MQHADVLSSPSGIVDTILCDRAPGECEVKNNFFCKAHWVPLESPAHLQSTVEDYPPISSFFASDTDTATQTDSIQTASENIALLNAITIDDIIGNTSDSLPPSGDGISSHATSVDPFTVPSSSPTADVINRNPAISFEYNIHGIILVIHSMHVDADAVVGPFICGGLCGVKGCMKSYKTKEVWKRHWDPAKKYGTCPYCLQSSPKQNMARHKRFCAKLKGADPKTNDLIIKAAPITHVLLSNPHKTQI
ncbi:hypothetical protein CPB86DRAFT_878772 [Serendipita vermifera]|nr:hypothetical protein CPB86DRAFT_878772 [Serendipita vermifera]